MQPSCGYMARSYCRGEVHNCVVSKKCPFSLAEAETQNVPKEIPEVCHVVSCGLIQDDPSLLRLHLQR